MELNLALNITVILIAISLFFSLADVFKIKWKQEAEKKIRDEAKITELSDLWHQVGFMIHCLIVIGLFIVGSWLWAGIGFILVWFVHNVIIAIGLGQKWWYVGTTAWTDIQIRKIWAWTNKMFKKIFKKNVQ